MPHISIILVDNHKLIRQGIRALLAARPEINVVAETGDGHEAIQLIEKLLPDIAIMDVMIQNLNGIEVAKIVQQRGFKTKVIFLSVHANATYAVRALQNGALGYVLKDSDFDEVLRAIESAMEGRRYLSEAISDEVLEMLLNTEAGNVDELSILSSREREILQMIAEGNTNAAIADKLCISIRTVEAHRLHTMKKLRLASHADLIKFAIQQGLISP